jgi:nucleotide-binding universal stress UspA family protein
MLKILLAVDGSESATRATRKLVESLPWYREPPTIDLLSVHLSVPNLPNMSLVISQDMLDSYYREECAAMLAPSRKVLDDAGVTYTAHWKVGAIAETIVEQAKRFDSDMIYMGTRGMTALSNVLLGSNATKVLHMTHIPIVLVH